MTSAAVEAALREAAREMTEHDAGRYLVVYYGNRRVERPAPRRPKAAAPKRQTSRAPRPPRQPRPAPTAPRTPRVVALLAAWERFDARHPAPAFTGTCTCGAPIAGPRKRKCARCYHQANRPAESRPCRGGCGTPRAPGANAYCTPCRVAHYAATHPPCTCGAPAYARGLCSSCYAVARRVVGGARLKAQGAAWHARRLRADPAFREAGKQRRRRNHQRRAAA